MEILQAKMAGVHLLVALYHIKMKKAQDASGLEPLGLELTPELEDLFDKELFKFIVNHKKEIIEISDAIFEDKQCFAWAYAAIDAAKSDIARAKEEAIANPQEAVEKVCKKLATTAWVKIVHEFISAKNPLDVKPTGIVACICTLAEILKEDFKNLEYPTHKDIKNFKKIDIDSNVIDDLLDVLQELMVDVTPKIEALNDGEGMEDIEFHTRVAQIVVDNMHFLEKGMKSIMKHSDGFLETYMLIKKDQDEKLSEVSSEELTKILSYTFKEGLDAIYHILENKLPKHDLIQIFVNLEIKTKYYIQKNNK